MTSPTLRERARKVSAKLTLHPTSVHNVDLIADFAMAIQREALERAISESKKAWPRTHNYASENSDLYIAQDAAVEHVIKAIRNLMSEGGI